MRDYGFFPARLREVQARISAAAQRSGRSPNDIRILAVTKFHPVEAVRTAYDAGIRLFGENRLQEAQEKFPDFLLSHADASVHMVGHLQGNKVKKAVELFDCVQSVDSEPLLSELDKRAGAAGRRMDVLLELHTGEETKSGFPTRSEILEACSRMDGLKNLRLRGLMTMAPFTDDVGTVRASFHLLHSVFDEVLSSGSFPDFDILSMGMSNDFETAIEEGATLLRLGTILFGPRENPDEA